MKGAGNLVFLLIIIAVFAVLFNSQRRRQRAALQVQHQLVPGARVMTTAGLFATVVSVEDTEVELEIAPGVVCRYARPAIGRVLDDDVQGEVPLDYDGHDDLADGPDDPDGDPPGSAGRPPIS